RGDVIGRRQPQVSASAPLGRGAGPLRLNPPAAATAAPSLWWSRRGSTTPGDPVCGGRLATEAQSAAAETRHNGGAPKPLCVHGGLGAPPLCRLQVLAERGLCASVSTLHRGLGHRDSPLARRNQPRGDQPSQSSATRSPPQWPPITPTLSPKAPRGNRTRQPDP